MDHDLLMMIYGALIGVGSSIVTTLFQSWLGQREFERRKKREAEAKLKGIYVPTLEETEKILGNSYNYGQSQLESEYLEKRLFSEFLMLIVTVMILGGVGYLIYQTQDSVLQVVVTTLMIFTVSMMVTKVIKDAVRLSQQRSLEESIKKQISRDRF